MDTQQILSIIALVALLLSLAVSLSKAKQAVKVSGMLFFLAAVLVAIGQILKEQKSNYQMLNCVGSCPPSIPPQPPFEGK